MRKIALISPWPEQKTGIADYAYDLAAGLAHSGVAVDVYSTSLGRSTPHAAVKIHHLDSFLGSGGYDQIVYQMGNSSDFHAEQLPVLFEHPGVVHLHDPTLHHLIAFFLYRDEVEDYYRVLQSWYGPQLAARVRYVNEHEPNCFWDSPSVGEVPFFDPVLEFATGCIVHSNYAKNAIRNRFPRLPISRLPQVYRGMQPRETNPNNGVLQLGAFGIVQPHKHLDSVLECIAVCRAQGFPMHLHVGGALETSCKYLPELAQSLGIESQVTFHGRMTEAAFLEQMRAVDICISLRSPTMGETSAVVSRALQFGLPTIVHDVGWYAELPACVVKLPEAPEATRSALIEHLIVICQQPQQLEKWRRQCLLYSTTACTFEGVISQYLQLLDQFRPPLLSTCNRAFRYAAA